MSRCPLGPEEEEEQDLEELRRTREWERERERRNGGRQRACQEYGESVYVEALQRAFLPFAQSESLASLAPPKEHLSESIFDHEPKIPSIRVSSLVLSLTWVKPNPYLRVWSVAAFSAAILLSLLFAIFSSGS